MFDLHAMQSRSNDTTLLTPKDQLYLAYIVGEIS